MNFLFCFVQSEYDWVSCKFYTDMELNEFEFIYIVDLSSSFRQFQNIVVVKFPKLEALLCQLIQSFARQITLFYS